MAKKIIKVEHNKKVEETFGPKNEPTVGVTNGVLDDSAGFNKVGLELASGKLKSFKIWDNLPEGPKNYYRKIYTNLNLKF